MLASERDIEMNSTMDEINLLRQAQRHHLVVREIGEEIDLEIGPVEDDPSFAGTPIVSVPTEETQAMEDQEDQKNIFLATQTPIEDPHDIMNLPLVKRKKKVVKKWREEWADTYKWAYVDTHEGTSRIFCSVCKAHGRKHRRNPYGNEGSRNMQMSALEEHSNSLLHKEALRLQMISSKDKSSPVVEKPVYINAGSIVESVLRRDPHEVEFMQAVQEVVHSLEPVLLKNPQYVLILERMLEPERMIVFRVPWVDDRGETHVNRGFRVQFSQVLGLFRGGLHFHPSMNSSVAKFLAFEQTLKNALSPYKPYHHLNLVVQLGEVILIQKGRVKMRSCAFARALWMNCVGIWDPIRIFLLKILVSVQGKWGFSLDSTDALLVIFREVLQDRRYSGPVLVLELKLLAMDWFSFHGLYLQR